MNHAATAHDKHAGHSVAMFKEKFWVCLLLTIPVLVYSEHIQQWLNFTPPEYPGSEYLAFTLSVIIFFYGGLVFLKGAQGELRSHTPGMMTLISLAVTTAFLYSVAVQFGVVDGEPFYWELATLTTIMLLGHWLEMASVSRAESALDAIKKLLPDTAEKLVMGEPQEVPVASLLVDDHVLVRPGANVPVDGVVTEGSSSVNEAALSGETKPVPKTVGAEVIAGTINQDGSLVVKVTKIGDDTALAGIMRLVQEAAASKSATQILADKAAYVLTLVALVSGILTFVYWLLARDVGFALERMVTVLIIACPHALGLAVPLVVSISTTLAAKNGLLVRKRLALESARDIDVVLFDKTGTLTQGEHGVTKIWAAKGYTEKDVLRLAASLEQNSEHVIGKGIVKEARARGIRLDKLEDFSALPGLGVRGKLGKSKYTAAGYAFITQYNLQLPTELAGVRESAKQGSSEVYIFNSKRQVIGGIAMADIIRPESKPTIQTLQSMGVKTAMITGDSSDVAAYVAKDLGIDQYFAEVRPEDKASKVKELQAQGLQVAMVGDGINDAPALAQADIGIAIGGGTDVAIKSADIILVKSDPHDVVKIIRLSNATYRKMTQNLAWGTGYNIFAIPLAAGALYAWGILLAPAFGAILMSLSTVVVAVNAQLLRRVKL